MLEVLVWIECLGFMFFMIMNYLGGRARIRAGKSTEKEQLKLNYYTALYGIFWWAVYPYMFYLTYKGTGED